ncbi:MAG: hypothetical protein HQL20_02195 [Candidatus Omnitrophica bacterium]|nr:hypothetical protein [Candidatus Omnitrophota bacterium]
MFKRLMLVLICTILCASITRAEDGTDELVRLRRQAQDERRKEEQIQMMRLELEKLKLEVETRKTMVEMGMAGAVSSPSGVANITVEVKNIVVSPEGASAVLEVGGSRQMVKAGDAAGPYTVKSITANEVVLVDAKGGELRSTLRI